MTDFFAPESLRRHTGGSFLARAQTPPNAAGVSIDSRELVEGQVFVALSGERSDGHDHLQSAADAGSPIAIVERDVPAPSGMTLVRVADCRSALARLARAYRTTLRSTRVVAVTGSNGKTTTVRVLDHVLSSGLRGSASRKSFNNDLGLPITMLGARPTDQYLVCEIGMSNPGEIRRLASMARPDVGVVTSVGKAHLRAFGSVSAIAREKASMLLELAEGGVAVVNADSTELRDAMPPVGAVLGFGEHAVAQLRLTAVEPTPSGVRFEINGRHRYQTPLLGAHNAWNCAAAVAVARRLGLADADIADALRTAAPAEMRLDRRSIGGVEIMNDAYNANPDSMRAALSTFLGLTRGAVRRAVVLGDMLELGDASPEEHRGLGEEIARAIRAGHGPDLVVLVGAETVPAADAIAGLVPPEMLRLEPEVGDGRCIAERLAPGDAVLLKGSRAMRLELVVAALESACDAANA
ncbi:MAG: UDP-N-acetylmuramoyl-tripeptide--D-alanyl-D-alanine ligase [Planctomycetota bacterium]